MSTNRISAGIMEHFKLGPFDVPRLWVGRWQLSGNAWGTAPASKIRSEMKRHTNEGFIAFGMFCFMTGRKGVFLTTMMVNVSRHGKFIASSDWTTK